MGKIAEPWEPFEIWITIEGNKEKFLVVPDREEPRYEVFDDHTSVGTVWTEQKDTNKIWCAEGAIAKELVDQIGEQIDSYKAWEITERSSDSKDESEA